MLQKIIFSFSLVTASAFAADEVCKFDMKGGDEKEPVSIKGVVTVKDLGESKFNLSAKFTEPEESDLDLGEAKYFEFSKDDLVEVKEYCEALEGQLGKKICDKVEKGSVIMTPDVGEDSNNSFLGHFKDKDGSVLGRFWKVGWLTGVCSEE